MNNKGLKIGLCVGIIAVISVILTIPSMWLIKNAPGNSFKTEMDFIATTLLVFVLWLSLIAFCVWIIRFLVNSRKIKKNPSGFDVATRMKRKNNDLKTISTARRIIIGILNVACIFLLIMFSVGACVFLGLGASIVGWTIFVIANACIMLLFLACAISDFTMMIKINKSPYDQKAINVRERGKRVFKVLIVLYILLYLLLFISLLLSKY